MLYNAEYSTVFIFSVRYLFICISLQFGGLKVENMTWCVLCVQLWWFSGWTTFLPGIAI